MSFGIEQIASFIPQNKISNFARKDEFGISDEFIREKIGFESISISDEKCTTLCQKAFEKLKFDKNELDCLILITQNADVKIPHTSAILHKNLGLKKECACFDLSLACSGFVYALSVICAFMSANSMKKGVILTCDTYSKITNKHDKNTALLFGDAATATLIGQNALLKPLHFRFGTDGSGFEAIYCEKDNLKMDGRAVFNFAATSVVQEIERFLKDLNLKKDEIDLFLLHQGSKYIVDNIARRLQIGSEKCPFDARNYGNTISSSLPIMLEKYLKSTNSKIMLNAFGAGFSWALCVLERTKNANFTK